jgi:hypothetical protein
MAFAQAKAGVGGPSGSATAAAAQPEGLTVSALSQRVWTLMQTSTSLESLSGGIGGAQDTTQLRQKLQGVENQGAALMTEIDGGLRKLRVGAMAGSPPDHTAQKQLKRLEEQYAEVRERFVKAVQDSRLKRRAFVPQGLGSGEPAGAAAAAAAAAAASSSSGAGKRGPRKDGVGEAEVNIQLENFTEVDAVIAEVSSEGV